jgi:hypothetical protein
MCDLYERQLDKRIINSDKYYFDELDRILDELFEIATDKGWSWTNLASEAGLAYQTVINLGERWTKRPQFRTVLLLARAVDYQILVEEREGQRPVLEIMSEAG